MTAYDRIFGAGPRGSLISIALFLLTHRLANEIPSRDIHGNEVFGQAVLALATLLTLALAVWSVKSLPPSQRGRNLVTQGAFKYCRHPLYAGFLLFFNFGLAVYMDHWYFVAWAALQLPIWHLNMLKEESLVAAEFPGEYRAYCATTGRFFPRFRAAGASKSEGGT